MNADQNAIYSMAEKYLIDFSVSGDITSLNKAIDILNKLRDNLLK